MDYDDWKYIPKVKRALYWNPENANRLLLNLSISRGLHYFKSNQMSFQCLKLVSKFNISISNFASCIMRYLGWFQQVKIPNISFARLVYVVV